jgi:cysteinyl-tRNA synthetase
MNRKIEPFIPLDEKSVGMYCCGPTVYNYAHIGNLRTYIFEDLLHRILTYAGYDLKHVMNITDVGHLSDDGDEGEDKMVKRSKEVGQSVYDIAKMYTTAFFDDTNSLNIITPDIACKATEHIQQMIDLIKRLEENGHTYISGGNVYFSIDTFPEYGKLARLNLEQLQSGARIEVDENKRNPKDFVLWFTKSKFENQAMTWPSPWGVGYPGWHIECSAMSMYYLGESFDIHCGGIDHVSVHHTNEIAQSEAATGKKWVNYWVHGEFLINETGKMSKSKGSFLTISVLKEKGYAPLDYRYFCLGGHYRSQLVFSWKSLDAAKNGRKNLMKGIALLPIDATKTVKEITNESALHYLEQFREHISVDLHIPQALALLWTLLKDSSVEDVDKVALIREMDLIFGLNLLEAESNTIEESIPQEIQELVEKRDQAKKDKNYPLADEVRAIVEGKGYLIKDTKDGPIISKKL